MEINTHENAKHLVSMYGSSRKALAVLDKKLQRAKTFSAGHMIVALMNAIRAL